MGERVVPFRKVTWNFFEQQRSTFRTMFKGMDQEFAQLDKELEDMRKGMFQLKALDFNNLESSFLKVERPIVQDSEGNRRLSLRFDCKDFKPEEIVVKTMDNRLMVQAKHLEESPGRRVYREFSRQYVLPDKIDPETLNSTMSADGVLSIEGPAPSGCEAPRERILAITHLQ
ncbi:alpha-crystallin A chain-like [Babylonia areolata]|uniref:alpha-crystallin A chain-like n=1 Tax=Babylonia areolata TaxID=304850 RepID=UPI003FD4068B